MSSFRPSPQARIPRRALLAAAPLVLAGCATALPEDEIAAIRRIAVIAAIGDSAELFGYSGLLDSNPKLDLRALELDRAAVSRVADVMLARDMSFSVTDVRDVPASFYEPGAGLLQWTAARRHVRETLSREQFDAVVIIRKGVGGRPGGGLATGLGVQRMAALGLVGQALLEQKPNLGAFANLSVAMMYGPGFERFNLVVSPWGRRLLPQAELDRLRIGLRVDDDRLDSAEAREALKKELGLIIRVATESALAQLGFRIPPPVPFRDLVPSR